jgi:hypothetical protein
VSFLHHLCAQRVCDATLGMYCTSTHAPVTASRAANCTGGWGACRFEGRLVLPTHARSWFENKGIVNEHHYCVFTGQHRAPRITPPPLLGPPRSANSKAQGGVLPMHHAEAESRHAMHPPTVVQTTGLATSQELRELPCQLRYKLLQLRLAAYGRAYGEVACLPVRGTTIKARLHSKQIHPIAWNLESKLGARFLTEWG